MSTVWRSLASISSRSKGLDQSLVTHQRQSTVCCCYCHEQPQTCSAECWWCECSNGVCIAIERAPLKRSQAASETKTQIWNESRISRWLQRIQWTTTYSRYLRPRSPCEAQCASQWPRRARNGINSARARTEGKYLVFSFCWHCIYCIQLGGEITSEISRCWRKLIAMFRFLSFHISNACLFLVCMMSIGKLILIVLYIV